MELGLCLNNSVLVTFEDAGNIESYMNHHNQQSSTIHHHHLVWCLTLSLDVEILELDLCFYKAILCFKKMQIFEISKMEK